MSTLMSGARNAGGSLVREGVIACSAIPAESPFPFYGCPLRPPHPSRAGAARRECGIRRGGLRSFHGEGGVCCATSGPGATNLTTGLVDAMMDSIPIVAITGQVTSKLIGSDAFRRPYVRHHASLHQTQLSGERDWKIWRRRSTRRSNVASTGRPGPVLVDVTKDVLQAQGHYQQVTAIHLPGYRVFTEGHAGQVRRAAQLVQEAQRPLVYGGGGIVAAGAAKELREFVELADTPAVLTLMGLGGIPSEHPNFHQHARYARQLRSQHGFDRLRPADRPGRAVSTTALPGAWRHSRRTPRSSTWISTRGNRQEPRARCAHRRRRQRVLGRLNKLLAENQSGT